MHPPQVVKDDFRDAWLKDNPILLRAQARCKATLGFALVETGKYDVARFVLYEALSMYKALNLRRLTQDLTEQIIDLHQRERKCVAGGGCWGRNYGSRAPPPPTLVVTVVRVCREQVC